MLEQKFILSNSRIKDLSISLDTKLPNGPQHKKEEKTWLTIVNKINLIFLNSKHSFKTYSISNYYNTYQQGVKREKIKKIKY